MISSRPAWHHWPVAALALVFYGIGLLDMILTKLRLGFYVDGFNLEQASFFSALPFWMDGLWLLGTLGGFMGAYMLWGRNRYSVILLFAAFFGLTWLTVWLTLFSSPSYPGLTGFLGFYVMAGTCALSFLFYTYARWERAEKKLH